MGSRPFDHKARQEQINVVGVGREKKKAKTLIFQRALSQISSRAEDCHNLESAV